MDVSVPFSPLPPLSLSMGGLKVSTRFFMGPPLTSRSGWKVSVWSWINPCSILVYNEVDILVLGEVCDEVLGQEVFECLSSGVQDIAWIDLKHI